MLRIARLFVLGLGLSFLAAGASAQADAAATEALMKKSGLWQQLAEIPQQMRAGVEAAAAQSRPAPDADTVQRLVQAAEHAFSAPALRAACAATIAAGLDPRHLPALDAWYDSAAGRALRQAEEAAAADTTEPAVAVEQGAALFQALPAPRRALLDELVRVTGLAEMGADLTIAAAVAMAQGMASLQDQAAAASPGEQWAALQAQRAQMVQSYRAVSLAMSARAYAAVPDGELSQYLRFLASDAGRHYNALGMQALVRAVADAARTFGRHLPGAST
ncbi:hypothetical protein [Pseudorhodoferax sp.]|uniref:hypothetical protein n=1 Tax=Pseudorhodoferax sp. TaxID=1993553 RepID=UPI0039E3900A